MTRAYALPFLRQSTSIVPPISLDSNLAIHPGAKGKEAVDVSEYRRAGRCGPLTSWSAWRRRWRGPGQVSSLPTGLAHSLTRP